MRMTLFALAGIAVFVIAVAVPLYGVAALEALVGRPTDWSSYTGVFLAVIPIQIMTGGWLGIALASYKPPPRRRT